MITDNPPFSNIEEDTTNDENKVLEEVFTMFSHTYHSACKNFFISSTKLSPKVVCGNPSCCSSFLTIINLIKLQRLIKNIICSFLIKSTKSQLRVSFTITHLNKIV